jgi:hypothetical protein
VKFFARLKADSFAGSDTYLRAGTRVAAYASLAWLHIEDSEPAEFDAIARSECVLHGFKDRIDSGFCLDAGESRTFYYTMDKVLLDQWGRLPIFR